MKPEIKTALAKFVLVYRLYKQADRNWIAGKGDADTVQRLWLEKSVARSNLIALNSGFSIFDDGSFLAFSGIACDE